MRWRCATKQRCLTAIEEAVLNRLREQLRRVKPETKARLLETLGRAIEFPPDECKAPALLLRGWIERQLAGLSAEGRRLVAQELRKR